jgi:hypothetical protein
LYWKVVVAVVVANFNVNNNDNNNMLKPQASRDVQQSIPPSFFFEGTIAKQVEY